MQVNFPNACAKCGEKKELTPWDFNPPVKQMSMGNAGLIYFAKLKVPVCLSCRDTLQRTMRNWKLFIRIGWLTILLAFIGGMIIIVNYQDNTLAFMSLFACFPMIMALVHYQKNVARGTDIGIFDGRRFVFKNEIFDNEFQQLNP